VMSKSGAILLFFESSGASEAPSDQFQWTLLQPSQLTGKGMNTAVWLKPGRETGTRSLRIRGLRAGSKSSWFF
jgi:hypothetical protein